MNEDLMNELKDISKGQWFNLPYGSYHHPDFTLKGATFKENPVCQRNTKERFEKIGITADMVRGKQVDDLGCNTGAMLLYAKQLGARLVCGIDNHTPNINFCKKLFEWLYPKGENSDWYFSVYDANKIDPSWGTSADILFCLAISKWVDYDHLIEVLSNSGAELIWFEDNRHMGKIIENIIPDYDCEFKFFSGPEANTPIGWKRVNYLCRRKK